MMIAGRLLRAAISAARFGESQAADKVWRGLTRQARLVHVGRKNVEGQADVAEDFRAARR